ncbi:MAG TPA: FKBP-type peptidyl-prolyl cis-trans isomerase [Allosphingosinicella sp.]|jgi:FKBP-type peptidyl-prolyl cis-trans isomerase
MLSLALLLAAAAPAPAKARPAPPPRSFIPPVSVRAVVTTPSGLRFETLRPGIGPKPTATDQVLVTYEGHLSDGTLFDAGPRPTAFPVSGVVPGFAEALQLMQKGGRYRFWIPSALAYGAEGVPGAIPPNAELEFIVTLIDMRPTPAPAPAQPQPQPQP